MALKSPKEIKQIINEAPLKSVVKSKEKGITTMNISLTAREQIREVAKRKGMSVSQLFEWLAPAMYNKDVKTLKFLLDLDME